MTTEILQHTPHCFMLHRIDLISGPWQFALELYNNGSHNGQRQRGEQGQVNSDLVLKRVTMLTGYGMVRQRDFGVDATSSRLLHRELVISLIPSMHSLKSTQLCSFDLGSNKCWYL